MRSEHWFIAYGLLGLTQAGLVPVLMPLASPQGGSAGLTYAAFSLSGIVAPLLGSWADRTGRHRDLLIWGTIAAGVLLLLFDVVTGPLQILLAAGAGLGAMATTTAGNVLAIQGQPEALWDDRVAVLQRYISAGQVIGLAAAGLLAHAHPRAGFIIAGFALLLAGALAFVSAPHAQPRSEAAKPAPKPMVGGDAGISGAHHRGHHLSWSQLKANLSLISRPLRHVLIVWMVAYPAMNGFATLFPLAMIRQFGMNPILPSCAYAIGVAASLLLYRPIGAATHRRGGGRTLVSGIGARLLLLAVLAIGSVVQWTWIGALALVAFALVQFVWPLLAVGANSLAVRLAPMAQGESVGLFNATTSLAAAVGSALAGVIFASTGFTGLTTAVFVCVAVALALGVVWLKEWAVPTPP